MSLLAVKKHLGVAAKDVLNAIRSHIDVQKDLPGDAASVAGFFEAAYAGHLSAKDSFFSEFLRYELIRTAYISAPENTRNAALPVDFNWGFNSIYLAVLKDKDRLLAPTAFPKYKTRIAFAGGRKNG